MSWNQQQPWGQSSAPEPSFVSADIRDERVGAFLSRVYAWMLVGLLITAATAFAVASTPALIEVVIVNRLVFWVIVIAQLGLVFYLSARVDKIAPAAAAGLFLLYSALVGVTSSVVLLVFTGASIVQTFIITGVISLSASTSADKRLWSERRLISPRSRRSRSSILSPSCAFAMSLKSCSSMPAGNLCGMLPLFGLPPPVPFADRYLARWRD